MNDYEFFLDPSRCIGCQACVHACGECDTHRGHSMIHLEYVDRGSGVQTAPVICMHCEDPTCAKVCPADAIKQDDRGIVHSAAKPRCIGCSNCVLACPFGVPKYKVQFDQMMKCDMCYDRTSAGKKPMCATVCPSGALYYGPREVIERQRREIPVHEFQFGRQTVRTKVNLMTAPKLKSFAFEIADFLAFEIEPARSAREYHLRGDDVAHMAVWDESLLAPSDTEPKRRESKSSCLCQTH